MLHLYSYYRSSTSYRVRIALNLKGCAYEQTTINLVTGEQGDVAYSKVNAQGLVPALRLPDGTILTQSMAIVEWLEEQYPKPGLYPADSIDRARARSLTNTIANEIHPLNNLRVLRYLSNKLGVSEGQRTAWYQYWIAQSFTFLESQLTASPYALGDRVGVVDVCLIPQVYNALRFEQDLSPYPRILSVCEACNQLEAFEAAVPEQQPDAQ